MPDDIRDALGEIGVATERIDDALADGSIVDLTFEALINGADTGRYGVEDVAEMSGIDPTVARALWLSLGFPLGGERQFSDADLGALAAAREFFDLPEELPLLLNQTRALSAATARLAETMTDRLLDGIRVATEEDVPQEEIALELTRVLRMDSLNELVLHMFRRQMVSVFGRRLGLAQSGSVSEVTTTVGFADLAGFTRMSHRLSSEELAQFLDEFESITIDTVAEFGGRVIKTIGDEIMFVADDTSAAVEIGLRLIEVVGGSSGLAALRVGLARGSVVVRRGDYFGDAVNKAARLTSFAYPDSVLASNSVKEATAESFAWRSLGRVSLKDLGPTRIWRASRVGAPRSSRAATTARGSRRLRAE